MISLIDVLPTLIDLAGGTPPKGIDGQSFADVLTEKKAEHRDRMFTTHSGDGRMNDYPIRSVRTRAWKYIRNLQPTEEHNTHIDRGKSIDGNAYWQSWVEKAKTDRDAAAVVARYHQRSAEELYDLRTDPHELQNLTADPRQAAMLRKLSSDLEDWMRQQNDNGLATENLVRTKVD